MLDGEEFYLTLPSNGAISMYEYPNNQNNSWKTRLNRPLKLEGEWEVGLVNVSYPSESRRKDYLEGLKDRWRHFAKDWTLYSIIIEGYSKNVPSYIW